MDDIQKEQLLADWLAGKLSPEEEEAFKQSADYPKYKDIITAMNAFEAPEYDQTKALAALKMKTTESSKPKTISFRPHIRFAVAASITIIICLSLYYLFLNNELDTKVVQTANAEKQTVVLPDGSEVKINAGSTIEYNEDEWKEDRSIKLKGEGYFKVKKGETFVVETNNGKVTVLGTSFNVRDRNNGLEVRCYTGKVKVENNQFERILTPGMCIRINNDEVSREWNIENNDPKWIKGITELDSVPMKEAIEELKRQFDLKVNDFNLVDTVKVSFPHDDPVVAIEQVLYMHDVDYEYDPHTKTLTILK